MGQEQVEEAVSALQKAVQISPGKIIAHTGLVATYRMMGRETEARAEATEFLRINPKFSLDFWAERVAYMEQAVRDNLLNALQKAGLK